MRDVVMMVVSAILGVLTLMIVMSIAGRSNRSMELKSSFSSIVEETVEEMAESGEYGMENISQFMGDFVENLASVTDSDGELTVNVMQADKERGILSVKVEERFTHPNGKIGTVETEKTVILNGKSEEPETAQYTVCFYLSREDMDTGMVLKEYFVKEGEALAAPKTPELEGKTFAGWKDEQDYLADFSLPVEQDRSYYAVWN